MHDPANRERMNEARRAGGRNKSEDVRTARQWAAMSRNVTFADVPALLISAGLATLNGEIEPQRVTALANAMKAAASIAEIGILEARVRQLETLLEADR